MPITVLDEYPPATPRGTCVICNSARRSGERIIDTGIYVERTQTDILGSPEFGIEARWAICGSCIEEAAGLLGLLSVKAADRLKGKAERLAEQLDEARIRADAAEAALDALRRYDLVGHPVDL